MFLSIIGNEKTRRFFFLLREKFFRGWAFAPEGRLYCPERSEGCNIDPREQRPTQGSKVQPKGILLSEKEQKSKGFYISEVGWYFLSLYTEFLSRLSVLGSKPVKNRSELVKNQKKGLGKKSPL